MRHLSEARHTSAPPQAETAGTPGASSRRWTGGRWVAVAKLLAAFFLFLVAIELMRGGARSLGHLLPQMLLYESTAHTLGLGWLGSYLFLSGSPVAAAALTLLDSGALTSPQAFTMIVGSRFGAIFVTVLFGLLYYWQGTHSQRSLAVGVLAYLTTFWLALGSLLLGLVLLSAVRLDFRLPVFLTRSFDGVTRPAVEWIAQQVTAGPMMLVGLGLLTLSFKLIDGALPDPGDGRISLTRLRRWSESPWTMFAIGFLLTLVSPSVTVSCGILVPLYVKGYVRASRLVPYVLGANISTFSDTLMVALMLQNDEAVHVVMTEIVAIAAVALGILVLGFSAYESLMERWTEYFTGNPRRLTIFLVLVFALPLALLFL